MGVIQNSVNSMMNTIMGGIIGLEHIKGQQAQLKDTEAAELGKIENAMTESELIAQGVPEEEAKIFNVASTLGLNVSPTYQPRYDELQRMKAESVLQSETYAKLKQDTLLRKKFSDLISTQEGRDILNKTLSKRDLKEGK